MLEGQLALARAAGPRRPGARMSFSWSEIERRSRSRPSARASSASAPSRERAPDHRRLLDEPPLERLERVEPRGQHRLDRVGQLRRLDRRPPPRSGATISSAKSGLPPERSATAGTTSLPSPPGRSAATSARLCSSLSGLEEQLGRVAAPAAPARAPLEQLVAREADEHAAARGPTGRGARSRPACRRRPSGCPRTRGRAAAWSPSPRCRARRAEKNASRIRSGSSLLGHQLRRARRRRAAARSGRPRARSARSSSPISSADVRASFCQASSEESASTIPHSARTTSPSAQKTMPHP